MEKVTALRKLMTERGLDAYVIPSGDPHASEYITDHWRTRQWLSGFTGSAGLVVVTQTEAGLWTDGRYFIQAVQELEGTGIDLFKSGEPDVPKYSAFLTEKLPSNGRLGFDGRTLPSEDFETLKKALKDKNITFAYQEDLIGKLWGERPPMPTCPAFEHEPQFAGKCASEKLADVRAKMAEKKITAYLVTALDDIAWLLNIRGNDILRTPVVYSYVLITEKDAHVFIDPGKIKTIAAKLTSLGFTLHGYDALPKLLSKLPTNGKLYYNSTKTNTLLAEAIPKGYKSLRKSEADIIPLLKAVKSETEISNIKNAFIKEGAVLVQFLKWLDESIGKTELTESDVAEKLTALRKAQPHYLEDSFETISAYGANAALMHYRFEGKGAVLRPEGFLLVDTGGQYLDGTTDTTRTIPLGDVTDEMKRDYTLVLKGHIALARARFLDGTTGHALDVLARQPLWQAGINYRCGTGHGIGYCLGVHEGPQSISPRRENAVALVPGMLLSNEPGVYKEGLYGIRTENILLVTTEIENEDGIFLGFTPVTYCPVDLSVVDKALLSEDEREYLNSYHKKTYEALAPLLNEEECAWLANVTKAI